MVYRKPLYLEIRDEREYVKFKFGRTSAYIGAKGDIANHVENTLKAIRKLDRHYLRGNADYVRARKNMLKYLGRAVAARQRKNGNQDEPERQF